MFFIKNKLLLFLILYLIEVTIQVNLENELENLEESINEIFKIIEDKNLDREDKKCKCEGEYKFNCTEACSPNGISFLVEGLEKSDFGLSLGSSDYQRSREANGKFKQ
ncbi:unnamed protein product [Meloidogyne enterolobii]|uniref:Uncharacterized protein n=1 Tax=Meloidogyne enterolobii TaxID=390850 RepID=A0ACB0ZVQ9_MELEN